MANQWEVLVMWMVWWRSVLANCPEECVCGLDVQGRNGVFCLLGNMTSIPVGQMDLKTQVVIVSAPNDDSMNFLTIGPIFTQPKPFTKLEELHIVRSNVPSIGQHSLWGLKNLKVLNLTHNNLSSVVDSNFRGLVNLRKLHLDHNRIEEMPSETFRYLTELEYLSLKDNMIPILVPRLFRMLAKLSELNLSDNPLVELNPEVFKDIQGLKVLKCRKCQLKMINTQLYHFLSGLQYLDLGENNFKYLMADEFRDLRKLQVLKYDGNQIPVVLEMTFINQTHLKELTFARNRLAMVTTAAFVNLTQLKSLNLSFNKLDKLDVLSIQPMAESLQELDISGNYIGIDDISFILQALPNIADIRLSNLNLAELPPTLFANNKHLRSLNLAGNKFTSFPFDALSLTPYLNELNMTRNHLKGLDDKSLQRMEDVYKIHLEGNPWDCNSCRISDMLIYKEKPHFNTSLGELICESPKSVEGLPLKVLSLHDVPLCNRDRIKRLGIGDDSRRVIAPVAFVVVIGIWFILCTSKPSIVEFFSDENKCEPEAENGRTVVLLDNDEDINYGMPAAETTFALVSGERAGVATVDSTARSLACDI